MMLREILTGCSDEDAQSDADMDLDTDIQGMAYDSRNVKQGYLFVAMKGEKFDGHDFVGDAIRRGAAVIVTEKEIHAGGTCILVKDSRKAIACMANNFYERPSESLTLTGITGTNGKTTTTYILKSVLESWGKAVGLIGTIRHMIRDTVCPALHTTPESLEFQGLLREMLRAGCSHVISEVSSHALAQHRTDYVNFDAAVFTNLTRDHLDYHHTMDEYFRAKERLFLELLDEEGTSVVNFDDQYGKRLVSRLRATARSRHILTYGVNEEADITVRNIRNSFSGLAFTLSFRGHAYDIASSLVGMPNVYNILSAAGAAVSLGIPPEAIIDGVAKAGTVNGRFERIDYGQAFYCFVDYAHTEDALQRLISSAREMIAHHGALTGREGYQGGAGLPRIITVFGCGGDRDRGKRPAMGELAARLSDFVIVTSDNPRTEDPLDIIRDIEGGIAGKNYLREPDRKKAIQQAVEMAGEGDIVLVAGKGHEDYQEIKGIRFPFSDREVLKEGIMNKLKIRHAR